MKLILLREESRKVPTSVPTLLLPERARSGQDNRRWKTWNSESVVNPVREMQLVVLYRQPWSLADKKRRREIMM